MKRILSNTLLLLMLALLAGHHGWAQGTTTSSMTGIITDQKGEALPGATIIAIHTPTNTQYVGPTNAQGRFNLQNMRVGGPYTVRITFVGFQDVTRSNVVLTVGQDYRLDAKMSEASTELSAVTVTGTDPRSTLNAERSGPVTNIGTEAIQRLPTINRSLNDFLRLTPQATPSNGSLAIGGGNYRQNNITVDGSDFNNNFGIGGNLPANGSPISIDAIEELTVNLTPFDVRQSGFVGGAVNAVTRSGSNEFKGSAYTFFRNQNFIGNNVGAENFTKQSSNIKQYGFRLGGPIIKDKLFFFINAEKGDEVNPGQQNFASNGATTGAGSYGSASNISRPSTAFLDGVSSYLSSTYNYATGPYQGYDFVSNNTRLLGRLDWNISNNNHFSIRYNQVESKSPSFVSTSRSPLSAFPNTRTSNFALPFSNANYFQESNFYSLAAELNSTIGHTHKFYNTARFTYTRQNDPRSSNSEIFPFVDILDGSVARSANGSFASYSNPLTSFGYEPFTAGNLRDVSTYSGVDFVSSTFGRHTLTAGLQFDLQTTKNGFQRFATSYYTYNSWDDFINKANPVDYALTYSLLPDYAQAYPRFKTAQGSLYLQDEFIVNDRFRFTLGLRAERNVYLDVQEVKTHPLVAQLDFNGRTINTGQLPQNRTLLSPRFGFNWDAKGDRSLQIRGGTGIFTGKVPTVWIVAQSGDAGLIQITQTYSTVGAGNAGAFSGLPGYAGGVLPFSADPAAHRPTTQPTPGTVVPSTLSATDPNFRNPQAWKSSLAVDTKLPGGIVGSLEGIYNRDLLIAYGQNYNLVEPTKLNVAGYADNRDIYPNATSSKFIHPLTTAGQAVNTGNTAGTGAFNPIVLSNGRKGYYWSVTAKLDKQFRGGLLASLAYVRSDARVMYDGSGDQLINTWSGTPIVNNANNPELSYANYVVPDRIVASLSYKKEYINHLATQVSFFYSGSSQGRFSYIYGGDLNRDGQNNDLLYIPKDASEITFSPFNYGGSVGTLNKDQQSALFFQYVDQDPYLSKHKGEYAERNGALLPWRHQVDFRFAQDIFIAAGSRNTLQFTLDVFNFGNLLNKNWGVYQLTNNASLLVPTNQASLVAGGTVTPTFRLATDRGQPISSTYRNNVTTSSTYYMQVGVRYLFN